MDWQKPTKETERTQWWARMTLNPSGALGGGAYGPGSYELLNVLLFAPFWLTYKLLVLPVKLCLYLLRLRRKAAGASEV